MFVHSKLRMMKLTKSHECQAGGSISDEEAAGGRR